MPVPESSNHNAKKSPVDHLRAFVASVMEPTKKEEETTTVGVTEEQQKRPFRGRDITLDKGEDKTMKFVMIGAGSVIVLVLLMLALSQKHAAHHPAANAPGLGRAQQAQNGTAAPPNGSIVPGASMQPSPAETSKRGKVTAQDLESNASSTAIKTTQNKLAAGAPAQTLGQIAPFNAGQSSPDNWAPKPFAGQVEPNSTQADKAETTARAKPSLVFVMNTPTTNSPSGTAELLTPGLDLGAGARLSARLNAIATTAVEVPVIADIEYSYERDGEIIVPAGTKAIGHIQQADRSGYVLIKFDRLEIPHRGVVPIDAIATNRDLGPIKGKVTGTHTGRNFLVRSFTDIGSGLAMFAGQNNTSGAISENDVLREQLAANVGNAGDQQIMQLMLTEHPIVTVPAGTDIFVVFEKTDSKPASNNAAAPSSRYSPQNLNELRELLEIQREMNQSPTPASAPSQ
jgi:hypothetical protein